MNEWDDEVQAQRRLVFWQRAYLVALEHVVAHEPREDEWRELGSAGWADVIRKRSESHADAAVEAFDRFAAKQGQSVVPASRGDGGGAGRAQDDPEPGYLGGEDS